MIQGTENIIERRYFVNRRLKSYSEETNQFIALLEESFVDISFFESTNFNSISKKTVVDYLLNTHAYYLDKMIPEIESTFMNIIQLEPSTNLTMIKLLEDFVRVHKSLEEHIKDEELIFKDVLVENALLSSHHDCEHLAELEQIVIALKKIEGESRALSMTTMLIQKLELFCKDLIVHEKIEDQLL